MSDQIDPTDLTDQANPSSSRVQTFASHLIAVENDFCQPNFFVEPK